MEKFTETFFVAIIGVIISLISFLVPLTYRFLRETAQNLGEWKAKKWWDNEKDSEQEYYIQRIYHYYVFADAIIDIIAVYGAFSILSIVTIMSKILIFKISSSTNIPFNNILTNEWTLRILLGVLYLSIWNIAWWDFSRYISKFNKDHKWLRWPKRWVVSHIILIGLTLLFYLLYWLLRAYMMLSYILIGVICIIFVIVSSCKLKNIEKTEELETMRKKFHSHAFWIFLLGLFLIAAGASLHSIFLFLSGDKYIGFGVIITNISFLVSFFLYWFLLGILFTPNTALIELQTAITNGKINKESDKENESSSKVSA